MRKSALFVLLLSSFALADSITLPTGGFLWVTSNTYTAGNVEGEYSATMPEIYSLQFGGDVTSQFYYKLGDVAYSGNFSNWSFQGGLFSGTFTGMRLDFYAGTWILRSISSVSGALSQQLNLLANCQGYLCGSMGAGHVDLSGVSAVPEPSTLVMLSTGLFLLINRRKLA